MSTDLSKLCALGRGKCDVEAALFETKIGQLLAGRFAKLRNKLPSLGRERLAGAPEFGFKLAQLGVNAMQFGVALLEILKFAPGFLAESRYFGEGGTVFALQRVNQVQTL